MPEVVHCARCGRSFSLALPPETETDTAAFPELCPGHDCAEPQKGDLVRVNIAATVVGNVGKASWMIEHQGTQFIVHEQSIVSILQRAKRGK